MVEIRKLVDQRVQLDELWNQRRYCVSSFFASPKAYLRDYCTISDLRQAVFLSFVREKRLCKRKGSGEFRSLRIRGDSAEFCR